MINKKQAAMSSIIAAIFLTSFKFIVGILTFSLGILSEALHSLLDLLAALITYFSVSISD
ncbi:MAG: cation transporter, partial [Parabacteroides sp.]